MGSFIAYLVVGKSVTTKSCTNYSTFQEMFQDGMMKKASTSYNNGRCITFMV